MNSNAKFGCLLYSTDLSTLHEDDMLFRRASLSRRERLNNKVQYKKSVKPIDFFLYNEIAFSNQCRVNDDVYEDGPHDRFDNRFYTFSSFALIKTKKDSVESEDSIIRSERDSNTANKVAYGAFNYAHKPALFLSTLHKHVSARTFCYTIMHIFKMTLDTLAYLKKNDAIHLGMSHESILIATGLGTTNVLIDGVHHIRFMKDLLKMNDKTLGYVLKVHFLGQPENKFPIAFAPVEVALLLFILNHDDLVSVSPNNKIGRAHV